MVESKFTNQTIFCEKYTNTYTSGIEATSRSDQPIGPFPPRILQLSRAEAYSFGRTEVLLLCLIPQEAETLVLLE